MKLITNKMSVSVVDMNPRLAEKILSLNVKNRKIAKPNLSSTVYKMKTSKWHENGESIIIGSDGVLKDGQHRLEATIKANHSWKAILVTGVDSNVMSSIDTGKNRSASDVLTLNGYSYGALKAATAKLILVDRYSGDGAKQTNICNQSVLDYVSSNNDKLENIISTINPLYSKQNDKVFSSSFLCFMFNKLMEKNIKHITTDTAENFFKMLCGTIVSEGSAVCWVRNTVVRNKNKGNQLQRKWIYNAVVKSWNIYLDGDIPVKSIRVSIDKLEQPKQLVY